MFLLSLLWKYIIYIEQGTDTLPSNHLILEERVQEKDMFMWKTSFLS